MSKPKNNKKSTDKKKEDVFIKAEPKFTVNRIDDLTKKYDVTMINNNKSTPGLIKQDTYIVEGKMGHGDLKEMLLKNGEARKNRGDKTIGISVSIYYENVGWRTTGRKFNSDEEPSIYTNEYGADLDELGEMKAFIIYQYGEVKIPPHMRKKRQS